MQDAELAGRELVDALREQMGSARVFDDAQQRELYSSDFYARGATCAAVIRPADTPMLAAAARLVTAAGFALLPRGGGMSYTGGYTPDSNASVVVDTADMQGIVAVDEQGMTITVRAGTTWEAIYKELQPRGLRLPFFGTFSGRRATVGGGLSNGAVFFGSARYGSAADQVLGLEVVSADGRILRTGHAAFRGGKPFYRAHGPDLTGLFLHDSGALGIKTEATFRLIEMPAYTECLSFAFTDAQAAAAALSQIGRADAAEEIYVLDPETTARNMQSGTLASDVRRLRDIVTGQRNLLAGIKAGIGVVVAGKKLVPAHAHSLHLACAARSDSAVQADAAICRRLAAQQGGQEIPNSIPLAARAAPFDNLNGAVGPAGERWAALNAKVPHSDVRPLIEQFDALQAAHQSKLDELNIRVSTLFTAMQTHIFSFEVVFHWFDEWLPMHKEVPEANYLGRLQKPQPNPAATAYVHEIRAATLQLFDQLGVASNQIGRAYPFMERLDPDVAQLMSSLKHELDPQGLMNPGALGLARSDQQNRQS